MAPIPSDNNDQDAKPFHVHITGFGPFGEHKTNPSWQAVKQLHETTLVTRPAPLASASSSSKNPVTASSSSKSKSLSSSSARPIHLTSTLIPVTYASSLLIVSQLHTDTTDSTDPMPDLIIHVGVGSPHSLTLEALARKFGYDKPDVDRAFAPLDPETGDRGFFGLGEVFDRSEKVLNSRVDLDKVLKTSRGERGGVEFLRISRDAGLFLCEFTFYASMAWARFKTTSTSTSPNGDDAQAGVNAITSDGTPHETPVQFIHVPPVGLPYPLPELTQALRIIIWAIVNEGGL
ncbi:BQ2448_7380 [Microbotryum intermedium]|uniref:BQ2448_7380 protein n=1 Tax=Microbotryum intermedium TaxID=269621 RepID=A0A238FNJ3_9BASI|nr:BQ2448_7380 [Microbotryum intermedium]